MYALIAMVLSCLAPAAMAKHTHACERELTRPYILEQDLKALSELAQERGLVIQVIAPNPASMPYSLRKGYRAKTTDLKGCKSLHEGPYAGLVQCLPWHQRADWEAYKKQLEDLGYRILDGQDYLVVNSDGDFYYSDYDLLGVYDAATGRSAFTEELRQEINRRLGRRMVRHGPLNLYQERDKIPLKFPVLAITPNQAPQELHSEYELLRFQAWLRYGSAHMKSGRTHRSN